VLALGAAVFCGLMCGLHRDTRDHTPNDTPTPHIRHTFMIPIDIF
jgi:hypothetical protein